MEFVKFNKIGRITRECIVTEKIDGTNGQICITEDGGFYVGSRSRWLSAQEDNYGFYKWALENKNELLKLGVGRHFGEWWGARIQRGYGLKEKRFSLFNVKKWINAKERPKCCDVVPILHIGMFDTNIIEYTLKRLEILGSFAAPGFMNPEGIIIYHTANGCLFKKTIHCDDKPKGLVEK